MGKNVTLNQCYPHEWKLEMWVFYKIRFVFLKKNYKNIFCIYLYKFLQITIPPKTTQIWSKNINKQSKIQLVVSRDPKDHERTTQNEDHTYKNLRSSISQ